MAPLAAGDLVRVLFNGKYFKAEIKKVSKTRIKVLYTSDGSIEHIMNADLPDRVFAWAGGASVSNGTPVRGNARGGNDAIVLDGANESAERVTFSPTALGKDLIGKRIKVYWPEDKTYYNGTITGFRVRSRKHVVLYDDDGKVEDLVLDSEKFKFLEEEDGDEIGENSSGDSNVPSSSSKGRKRKFSLVARENVKKAKAATPATNPCVSIESVASLPVSTATVFKPHIMHDIVRPALSATSLMQAVRTVVSDGKEISERASVVFEDGSRVTFLRNASLGSSTTLSYRCVVWRPGAPESSSEAAASTETSFWKIFAPAVFAAIRSLGSADAAPQCARLSASEVSFFGSNVEDESKFADLIFGSDHSISRTPQALPAETPKLAARGVSIPMENASSLEPTLVPGISGCVSLGELDRSSACADDAESGEGKSPEKDDDEVVFVGKNTICDTIEEKFKKAASAGNIICVDEDTGAYPRAEAQVPAVSQASLEGLERRNQEPDAKLPYLHIELKWVNVKQSLNVAGKRVALGNIEIVASPMASARDPSFASETQWWVSDTRPSFPRFFPDEVVSVVNRAIEKPGRCADLRNMVQHVNRVESPDLLIDYIMRVVVECGLASELYAVLSSTSPGHATRKVVGGSKHAMQVLDAFSSKVAKKKEKDSSGKNVAKEARAPSFILSKTKKATKVLAPFSDGTLAQFRLEKGKDEIEAFSFHCSCSFNGIMCCQHVRSLAAVLEAQSEEAVLLDPNDVAGLLKAKPIAELRRILLGLTVKTSRGNAWVLRNEQLAGKRGNFYETLRERMEGGSLWRDSAARSQCFTLWVDDKGAAVESIIPHVTSRFQQIEKTCREELITTNRCYCSAAHAPTRNLPVGERASKCTCDLSRCISLHHQLLKEFAEELSTFCDAAECVITHVVSGAPCNVRNLVKRVGELLECLSKCILGSTFGESNFRSAVTRCVCLYFGSLSLLGKTELDKVRYKPDQLLSGFPLLCTKSATSSSSAYGELPTALCNGIDELSKREKGPFNNLSMSMTCDLCIKILKNVVNRLTKKLGGHNSYHLRNLLKHLQCSATAVIMSMIARSDMDILKDSEVAWLMRSAKDFFKIQFGAGSEVDVAFTYKVFIIQIFDISIGGAATLNGTMGHYSLSRNTEMRRFHTQVWKMLYSIFKTGANSQKNALRHKNMQQRSAFCRLGLFLMEQCSVSDTSFVGFLQSILVADTELKNKSVTELVTLARAMISTGGVLPASPAPCRKIAWDFMKEALDKKVYLDGICTPNEYAPTRLDVDKHVIVEYICTRNGKLQARKKMGFLSQGESEPLAGYNEKIKAARLVGSGLSAKLVIDYGNRQYYSGDYWDDDDYYTWTSLKCATIKIKDLDGLTEVPDDLCNECVNLAKLCSESSETDLAKAISGKLRSVAREGRLSTEAFSKVVNSIEESGLYQESLELGFIMLKRKFCSKAVRTILQNYRRVPPSSKHLTETELISRFATRVLEIVKSKDAGTFRVIRTCMKEIVTFVAQKKSSSDSSSSSSPVKAEMDDFSALRPVDESRKLLEKFFILPCQVFKYHSSNVLFVKWAIIFASRLGSSRVVEDVSKASENTKFNFDTDGMKQWLTFNALDPVEKQTHLPASESNYKKMYDAVMEACVGDAISILRSNLIETEPSFFQGESGRVRVLRLISGLEEMEIGIEYRGEYFYGYTYFSEQLICYLENFFQKYFSIFGLPETIEKQCKERVMLAIAKKLVEIGTKQHSNSFFIVGMPRGSQLRKCITKYMIPIGLEKLKSEKIKSFLIDLFDKNDVHRTFLGDSSPQQSRFIVKGLEKHPEVVVSAWKSIIRSSNPAPRTTYLFRFLKDIEAYELGKMDDKFPGVLETYRSMIIRGKSGAIFYATKHLPEVAKLMERFGVTESNELDEFPQEFFKNMFPSISTMVETFKSSLNPLERMEDPRISMIRSLMLLKHCPIKATCFASLKSLLSMKTLGAHKLFAPVIEHATDMDKKLFNDSKKCRKEALISLDDNGIFDQLRADNHVREGLCSAFVGKNSSFKQMDIDNPHVYGNTISGRSSMGGYEDPSVFTARVNKVVKKYVKALVQR